MDAAAVEALLGEFFGEDDLGGDENGGLAGLVGDGDFDEGPGVVTLAALEAQAALGHVLALDDVVAALRMADAGGVVHFDAGMLAAVGASGGRGWLRSGARYGEDGGLRFADGVGRGAEEVRAGGDRVSTRIGAGGAKVGGRIQRELRRLSVIRGWRRGVKGRSDGQGDRRGIVIGGRGWGWRRQRSGGGRKQRQLLGCRGLRNCRGNGLLKSARGGLPKSAGAAAFAETENAVVGGADVGFGAGIVDLFERLAMGADEREGRARVPRR